jgi:hypothetical protein
MRPCSYISAYQKFKLIIRGWSIDVTSKIHTFHETKLISFRGSFNFIPKLIFVKRHMASFANLFYLFVELLQYNINY